MIIETIAGIITAASTGVTAVYSVVRFNKKLQKEKLDRKRLLEDLISLKNSVQKINDLNDYRVFQIDKDDIITQLYFVLSYKDYLSNEEFILLQRIMADFEQIDVHNYAYSLKPALRKAYEKIDSMIKKRKK